MRDGHLRGTPPPQATQRQMDVLAAYVAAGGSVADAADLVGIRTEQLIYAGRAGGWLAVPSLEPAGMSEPRAPRPSSGPAAHADGSLD